jgi:hypothetical protein
VAADGEQIVSDGGEVKTDAEGNRVKHDGGDCESCCGEPPEEPCYYRVYTCADNTLTGWKVHCTAGGAVPYYIRRTETGACYKVAGPPVSTPGVPMPAYTVVDGCLDEACVEVEDPDVPPGEDDEVPFNDCSVAVIPLASGHLTLSAGGAFSCDWLYDPSPAPDTEPDWDGKMCPAPDSFSWGNGLCGSAPTYVVFGGKILNAAGVSCQPKGNVGFEEGGGWLLIVSMLSFFGTFEWYYKKIGGTTPHGHYSLIPDPGYCGHTGGGGPGGMTIG